MLQLASSTEAFVVDVLMITRAGGEPLALLGRTVSALLRSATAVKLGFASHGDLERLEAALPGCTGAATNLVDVQPLVRAALGLKSGATPGLRHACAALLQVELSKEQQTSDWEQRPLTTAQLMYAATDASVLLPLHRAASKGRCDIGEGSSYL